MLAQSYKNVVHHIEKFLGKVRPEYRLSCIYIIDSICRNAKTKLGEKDNFTPRFGKNIVATLEKAFMSPKSDHENIKRVVGLWAKNNLFDEETREALFEVCRTKTGSYPGITIATFGLMYSYQFFISFFDHSKRSTLLIPPVLQPSFLIPLVIHQALPQLPHLQINLLLPTELLQPTLTLSTQHILFPHLHLQLVVSSLILP